MFNKEKNNQKTQDQNRKSSNRNIIDNGTKIVGDIVSEGDFRIDGHLEGTLKTSGRVIIGKNAIVNGKVECRNADVEGQFSGEFIVDNTFTAKSTAIIKGDLVVGQISTELGAEFDITCNMKGTVKDLNSEKSKTA